MSRVARNPLLRSVSDWFNRNFSDPAASSLFMTLLLGLLFIEIFGRMFMPILVSIVVAYLLIGMVQSLINLKTPRLLAVMAVYLLFLGVVIYLVFGLMPLLWGQLAALVKDLPNSFAKAQVWLNHLAVSHQGLVSTQQIQSIVSSVQGHVTDIGQYAIKSLLGLIPGVFQVVIYLILVPVLVLFFVKDAPVITEWLERFLPNDRSLLSTVWAEVNHKIGAYVRGRVLEVFVVGIIASITFKFLGLHYAVLLGALVGVSVIIPYVGAVIVTIPILIVAVSQWGFTAHFISLLAAYAIILVLDAYLLVPFLFSEAMNLHPVVIILSVVIFGAIWGFWGVFFSIPLATLADVVLTHWPTLSKTKA